jgi:spermidine/putrescine transport system permease protein
MADHHRSIWPALPALAIIAVFLALPLALVSAIAFCQHGAYGEIEPSFTLDNLARLWSPGVMGGRADFPPILARSAVIAGVATLAAVALGLPLAFWIAAGGPLRRALGLGLVTVPFCTNLVVRTYGWVVLLSSKGPLAPIAHALGLIGPYEGLAPSLGAELIGTISSVLPFAVLPLYASVERLDRSLIDAANDLYASPPRVFRHAVLPQIMPGLWVATVLTFVPAVGLFLVSNMLGQNHMLIGELMQQQFGVARDWPYGAAIGLVLVLLSLLGLAVAARRMRALEGLP